MPTQGTMLRRAAVATIAAASLLLPMLAVAQADQRAGARRVATMHPNKHKRSRVAHKELTGPALNVSGCPWPYTNRWPPCQSTFPEGDPNYSGSTGAP